MYQVLLVDDEPIVKIALRSIIDWEKQGFHICAAASNGEEALEMTERYHPDLIITDLKMPIMDGIQLIQTIQERKLDCEFLVISNYEDFNFVRTALVLGASDYILKVSISEEELTKQLVKIKEKLDQKASKDQGDNGKEDPYLQQEQHTAWREFFTHRSYPISNLSRIMGESFEEIHPLALCHISFDWYTQNLETLPSTDLIRSTLKNALEPFEHRRIILFSSSNTLLVIPEEELKKHQYTIGGLAARISQLFQYYMSLTPAVLYQSGIQGLNEARNTYHNFQELLELSFYGPLEQVDAGTLSLTASIPDLSHRELSKDILEQSSEHQLEYACTRLTEIFQKCKAQNVMPGKLIQYCLRLIGDLEYHMPGISTAVHDRIADNAEFVRTAISLEELEKHLMDALSALFVSEPQADTITDQYSPEITQAISYIQSNYNKKISLTSVAECVGLSSGYLCRIFKEETSISINTYINNLRMTQAGELLKDKNSYIKEVAISVGFDDQLYFSRQFKRYYGMTPSEYRSSSK